jgi:hypothetical protein
MGIDFKKCKICGTDIYKCQSCYTEGCRGDKPVLVYPPKKGFLKSDKTHMLETMHLAKKEHQCPQYMFDAKLKCQKCGGTGEIQSW